MEKSANGILRTTIEKVRDLVDVSTIIGDPINLPDGLTIVPVSKVTYGFASGGSDFNSKQTNKEAPFGGGAGAAVKVTPAAFIVVKDGNTRVLSLTGEAKTMDKIIDAAPGLIDKFVDAADKLKKNKDDKEA